MSDKLREALSALVGECDQRYAAFDGGDTSSETYLIAAAYAWCSMEVQRILAAALTEAKGQEPPIASFDGIPGSKCGEQPTPDLPVSSEHDTEDKR